MNWKMIVGLILMAPMTIVGVAGFALQWGDPALTPTQVSFSMMPYMLMALIPFVAGMVLFGSGKNEYDETE